MMQHCRLSIREAAILHRVDVKQIGHWQSGRRVAPPGVINELRELDAAIQQFVDALIQLTSDLLDEAGDAAMLTNVECDQTRITSTPGKAPEPVAVPLPWAGAGPLTSCARLPCFHRRQPK